MEILIKTWKKIIDKPMLIVFVLLTIIYTPSAISMPSHSFRNAIIIALAIDKIENPNLNEDIDNDSEDISSSGADSEIDNEQTGEYSENSSINSQNRNNSIYGGVEVSVLTLSQSNKEEKRENNKMISASGSTVALALSNLEIRMGRKAQMGHLRYIIVSEEMSESNLSPQLDMIIRSSKIANSVPLVISKSKAQQVILTANKLEKNSGIKLSEIFSNMFNEDFLNETSIESFVKGYYSQIKTSTAGYIELTDNLSDGISASDVDSSGGQSSSSSTSDSNSRQSETSGSSGGGNTGASGGENSQQSSSSSNEKTSKEIISFKKNTVVFKDGKKVEVLSDKISKGLNWIRAQGERQFFSIRNINDNNLNDATITFKVETKKINTIASIINNVPKIKYEIELELSISEIIQHSHNIIANPDLKLTSYLSKKINDEIKSEFCESLNYLKQNKIDIINAYFSLLSYDYKKWNEYLDLLSDKSDYMNRILFGMEISAKLI